MSTEAVGVGPAAVPAQQLPSDGCDQAALPKQASPSFLHSPPDSNNAPKTDESDSELSDLDEEPILPSDAPLHPAMEEEPHTSRDSDQSKPQSEPEPEPEPVEEDIGEVLPDHWSGAVAVFKPTMHQFKDFSRFMEKVNSYGMKSGIIKIIPPKEWLDKQPPLDDLVKHVRVREPIKQDIMGSNGTYRQVNILHGRSYNVPQWRTLCEQSEHQPPARRGERRANADKPKAPRRPPAPKPADGSTPTKRGNGKVKRGRGRPSKKAKTERPMTPVSPKPEPTDDKDQVVDSVETTAAADATNDENTAAPNTKSGTKKSKSGGAQSVSARRKYGRREGSAMIDEAAFKDFDYRMDISDYTPERCEELERAYWKTLTYASPLYGADMMGTLFDDRTESWNLGKLPNILDVLGTKIPGVNCAYLYFGMWKATFAWHLEDVDLYSINYVHFGAPKQWYSISQADARRFEAAMKNIWPADAKACSQFLRHKGFLISPQHLLQHYGIKVNKVVSYPGEFVVTFPYGYHSGYNLGYNCAEAVNFALEPWLEMGKIAKRCECAQAQDSVWINVWEIERKLRGEETEYEETDEEEEEEEGEDEEGASGLPSPPSSHGTKIKIASRKRKRTADDKGGKTKVKKIKLRLKSKSEPPCCLCPNDIPAMELLPTDDGRKAHRICALYLPETYVDMVDGKEVVSNAAGVHKDRTDLKCLFCRSKRGACFQCSQKKCARAYHATCAAAAGVFVEEQEVPVFGEDSTEYKEQAFEFSCRFHRTKRDKKLDGAALEDDDRIRKHAGELKKGDVCQLQYYKGDIFAGVVAENRVEEETLLVDVLPHGDRVEFEWKWLLLPDPADYHLPKASANAIPMPASQKAKDKLNAKRQYDDKPRKDDIFSDGYTWAEFNLHEVDRNPNQAKVDLARDDQVWFYLGKTSTDAKAQYTEDPAKQRHNPKGNYLDTLPKPPKPPKAPRPSAAKRQSYTPQGNSFTYPYSTANMANAQPGRTGNPYMSNHQQSALTASASAPQTFGHYNGPVNGFNMAPTFSAQRFDVSRSQTQPGYSSAQYQVSRASPQGPSSTASQKPSPQVFQAPSQASLKPSDPPAQAQSRQPSKYTWQVHPSIYQKYAFFQVHHNRDSSKYRTPYAPWGGFTNGYEGDLRAHLMANPQDLMRRASLNASSNVVGHPAGAANAALPASTPTESPTYTLGSQPQTPSAGNGTCISGVKRDSTGSKIPYGDQTPGSLGDKPKPPQVTKSYKVPSKQSPVPLPASFLAAMSSSPSSPLSRTATVQTQSSPGSTKVGSEVFKPAQQSPGSTVKISGIPSSTANATQNSAVRVSMTPVPIPKFPGMTPHQAAARAITSETGVPAERPSQQPESVPFVRTDAVVCESTSGITPGKNSGPDGTQEFPDVPGCESMEFMEKMMADLRRIVGSSEA